MLVSGWQRVEVIVQATGNALTKAVTAAEVIKRRFKGLHQITELKTAGTPRFSIDFGAKELRSTSLTSTNHWKKAWTRPASGRSRALLGQVTDVRTVSVVEIKLSKAGYTQLIQAFKHKQLTC